MAKGHPTCSIMQHHQSSNRIKFIRTPMGRECLELNKFIFLYNKTVEKTGTTYWRCSFSSARKKIPCEVRCITRHGILQKVTGFHNHPPPPPKKAFTKIKETNK
uniref:FLYWCH-type domain-containing protein n=2 Tax=Lutzomyia longipalpis TaxID=7200 RepID=A0A1B0CAM2_LUTLO